MDNKFIIHVSSNKNSADEIIQDIMGILNKMGVLEDYEPIKIEKIDDESEEDTEESDASTEKVEDNSSHYESEAPDAGAIQSKKFIKNTNEHERQKNMFRNILIIDKRMTKLEQKVCQIGKYYEGISEEEENKKHKRSKKVEVKKDENEVKVEKMKENRLVVQEKEIKDNDQLMKTKQMATTMTLRQALIKQKKVMLYKQSIATLEFNKTKFGMKKSATRRPSLKYLKQKKNMRDEPEFIFYKGFEKEI